MKASHVKWIGPCFCAAVFLGCALAQTAPLPANDGGKAQEKPSSKNPDSKNPEPTTTFHAETRLVVLDVVVTGPHRQAVTGLTKSDFSLLEDGAPQRILFFEAHVPPSKTADAQLPLPAHQYTNVSAQSPSSINIILFDTLNTPLGGQSYAREQMLQFLKTLPPGQPMALFQLGSSLRMIAGFTTRSEDLVTAARKSVQQSSVLLDSRDERQQDENQLGLMRQGSPNQGFFDLMQQAMDRNWATRDQNRAYATLQAFGQLAHGVSGFRGRKNVIWLAEEFPVYFGPEQNTLDPSPNVQNYATMVRDTAGMLSSSQMSIYPIDVRGLTPAVGSASSAGGPPGRDEVFDIETLHIAMDELAQQTGGRAYYNTNDLKLAMQSSLDNGSHYYTLAYAPQNRVWNSKYRHVKIHLARSGLEAEYREGYFATPEKQPSEDEARAGLISAIQPATPQSTMLVLRAQVLPPDAEHANVRIDCVVDAAGVAFTDGSGGRKSAKLEFVTVAWDMGLKAALNASHTAELNLPPEKYESVMHNGIAAHQELRLRPGSYILRLGVMDDGSRKIGTLDIPLQISGFNKPASK